MKSSDLRIFQVTSPKNQRKIEFDKNLIFLPIIYPVKKILDFNLEREF